MRIMTARPLPWFANYAITWRQLSDGCRNPVVGGFEATGVFKTGDVNTQGEDLPMPSADEDGSPQLSIDMCAPYGYYELEINVEGENTDGHGNTLDIEWQIDAESDKSRNTIKWSGIAELSNQHKPSTVPSLRYTASKTSYVWPVKNEAGYQPEEMWSGPEPQDCADFSKVVPGTSDEGCYDFFDNQDIFREVGTHSSGMTKMKCKNSCQEKGYGYSATANGKVCLCGDTPPRYKRAIDSCGVPCPGDLSLVCSANGSNWYLNVLKIFQIHEDQDGSSQRRTLILEDETVAAPANTYAVEEAEKNEIFSKATETKVVAKAAETKVEVDEPKSTYNGCFAVKENPGVLTTHVNCNLKMSNKVCKDECLKLGLWYAATTLGTECYCGDKAPVWDTKEVFCELKCEDKAFDGKNCGGWGFMSVFELSRPGQDSFSYGSLAPTGEGSTYEGCYNYNAKPNRNIFNKFVTSSEWMTNKKCQTKCREIKHWYSATIQGTDCYCGDTAPVGRTASHWCNLPCEDSTGKGPNCGGWGFMDVFHIDKLIVEYPVDSPSFPEGKDGVVSYEGCYGVKENPDVFNKFVTSSEWMTNEKCQKKCREIDHWYSATTRGKDCYCSDKAPAARTSSYYCDVPCEDSEGKGPNCGGWGFMDVFHIEKPVGIPPPPPPRGSNGGVMYNGCYSIKENPDVFNKFVASSKDMTNEKCEQKCREIEHWYSATTRGKDCYCGDKTPVWKTDDKFCELPCDSGKDKGRSCGGWGFMTVFHISKPDLALPEWTSPGKGAGGGVTYKGCYDIDENVGIFDKLVASSRWMTNEKCETKCREIDNWYSATTYGTDCYCGDKAPVWKTSDWHCDLPCEESGKYGQDGKDPNCGGWGYLTVFQIHEFVPYVPTTPVRPKEPDVVEYTGCYDIKDNPKRFDKLVISSKWMTNEKCQKKCRETDNWYSATTDGTECYCADKAPVSRTSDWYCDIPCEEDVKNGKDGRDPKCGGWGYLTVFHTSKPVKDVHTPTPLPPKEKDSDVAYKGCYGVEDNSGGFSKLVKSSKWMTHKVCQDKCRETKQWYSAMTEGTDCYCGDQPPVHKRDDGKCNIPCVNDSDIKCGGWGFMNVMHFQKPVPVVAAPKPLPPKKKGVTYKGCYAFADNSGVFNRFMKSSEWMTNEACQKKCEGIEYWYSATIEGTDCYCGDKPPVHERDEWHCNHPCENGADIKCGGWGFMTVFEIPKPTSSHRPVIEPKPTSVDFSEAEAKGCFEDTKSKRALEGYSYNSDAMTAQECGRVCKEKGHKVFGVEFGRECFCGDKMPEGDGKADKCDKPCAGDRNKICGGHSRINIYQFAGGDHDLSKSDKNPSSKNDKSLKDDKVDGAKALGCYEDDSKKRVLEFHSFDDETKMTAQKCGGECHKEGYKIFGTEFGRECFCGHALPAAELKADKCDAECTGNKKVACGGRNRINIFEWNDSEPNHNWLDWDTCNGASVVGCFKDDSRHRVLGGSKKDDEGMSAQVCGDFCKDEGYAYFGTQYSKECFCGNDFQGKDQVEDGECDYACAGKSSAACGGKNLLSVFKLDEPKKHEPKKDNDKKDNDKKDDHKKDDHKNDGAKKGEEKKDVDTDTDKKTDEHKNEIELETGIMLGCFKDSRHKRVLDLKSEYKLDNMTPEICYLHCKGHDAVYYGVEYGKECFCGNRDCNFDESPLDISSCSMPCSGDHTKYCGGRNAINVYGPSRRH